MKTILVVDDELKITRLLRDYLQQAGFRVVTATDGPAALTMARAERPDMIVLDLGLPGLDGLDVTRTLRKNSDVPIIMLTARAEEADRILAKIHQTGESSLTSSERKTLERYSRRQREKRSP